jgi:uncharacterized protein (DUF2141 family)
MFTIIHSLWRRYLPGYRMISIAITGLILLNGCATPEPRLVADGLGNLSVIISDFRNNQGEAILSLFSSSDGFPDDIETSLATNTVKVTEGRAQTLFKDLAYGEYAISVLHDEDGDGQMKNTWFGTPLEGFGFSGHPDYKYGHPKFAEVKFLMIAPSQEINIKLRYETARQRRLELKRQQTTQ